MFLHKPDVYFADDLDKVVPCRCCKTLFKIRDGVCYEGWVAGGFNSDGTPTQIAWVRMMFCLVHPEGFYACVTRIAIPDHMSDKWEVTVQ